MLIAPFILIVAFTQLVISLGILLESRRSNQLSQKIFVALSSATFFWTIANILLIDVNKRGNLGNIVFFNVANKAGFTLGAISLLLIYIFNLYYPVIKQLRRLQKFVIGFGLSLILLSPFSIISGGFTHQENGGLLYYNGILSIVFALFAVFVLVGAYIDNAHLLRITKEQLLRRQTITILTGLTLTVVHAVLFLIILPQFYPNNDTLYALGYCAPYYYMGFTIYSLIKQRLFDVRLIIARVVGYILLIVALASIYATIIFGISMTIQGNTNISLAQRLFFVIAALFLAFTFQPLKRFFDKVTNKFFYSDAYDPQKFIDQLNQTLVSTIDLNTLLVNSSKVIQENLKSSYSYFWIKEGSNESGRSFVDTAHNIKEEDLNNLRHHLDENKQGVIVTDELTETDLILKNLLNSYEIGAIGQLTTGKLSRNSNRGYIIIGAKKSGNLYNKQDIKVLEIITNELAIAIQNALRFEEIQQFNITLQQKIDDATHQLRRANEKLKALDETKDEFISMASHQLRTPLTSVKGYVSMVLEGDVGKVSGPQRKLLDQAFISSQRMVYLIADLLNVSRLRTGKFVIDAQPTNLADLVEGEINQLTETAKGRGLELTYNKPKDFPALMLDETKTRQVIMNFADNAIYYTPSGGHISVNLAETPESIEFTVVDDGLGVPKHDQHHMFTKFFRAGNAKKARPDGTGLGLFMAKKVIIAQGGAIIFSSTEGKGSTFGFSFPKAKLKVNSVSEQKKT